MKPFIWIVVALAVFVGVILGTAAVKGQLSADAIKRIAGIEAEPPPPDPNANLGPLAQTRKAQQEKWAAWQRELADREARRDQREQLLDQTLAEITKMREEVMEAMEALDEEQVAALTDIAKSMEKMDPKNAAVDLEAMEPEKAARLVPLIKTSSRGKILDEMNADARNQINEVLQAKKY